MENFDTLFEYIFNPDSPPPSGVNELKLSQEQLLRVEELRTKTIQLQQQSIQLLSENNEQINLARKETFEVASKLKKSLVKTLKESQSSQTLAKIMFMGTFLLGFSLIISAIYFATQGLAIISIAFGTIGVASLIANLIADPPLKLQDSRSNYTQLTIATLAWFNDFNDKSVILSQNNQWFIHLISNNTNLEVLLQLIEQNNSNYMQISDAQFNNAKSLLRVIEEVAEPTQKLKTIVQEEIKKEAKK